MSDLLLELNEGINLLFPVQTVELEATPTTGLIEDLLETFQWEAIFSKVSRQAINRHRKNYIFEARVFMLNKLTRSSSY